MRHEAKRRKQARPRDGEGQDLRKVALDRENGAQTHFAMTYMEISRWDFTRGGRANDPKGDGKDSSGICATRHSVSRLSDGDGE